jgi:ADP-ribose pyrophosphatase YjhB (NUDIX family)
MRRNNKAGILVYRFNKLIDDYEYMIVRKLFTHEFMKIITAKYNSTDNKIIFSRLSILELFILKNYPIGDIYRTFFKLVDISDQQLKIIDKIVNKYNKYIENNKSVYKSMLKVKQEVVWEIPKGNIEYCETQLDCGLRELYEETSIEKKDICKSSIEPINEYISYNRNECRIIYHIYKYIGDDNDILKCNVGDEIICKKWVTLTELEFTYMNISSKNVIYKIHKQLIEIHNKEH